MKRLSVFLTFFLVVFAARAGETVRYGDIKALRGILPQRTDYYTIDDVVEVQEPYYVFKVSSAHHPLYTVVGISGLMKVCHEITMMEWFYTTETGSQVWVGVKDSVKSTAEGAKQLVLHPGDSFQGMKRSAKRTGRMVKDFFKGVGKDNKSSDGKNLEAGAGNFFTSEAALKVAYELRLDAYTQNVWARKLIENIALRRTAGGAAVSVSSSMIVPMSTLVSVSSSFAINGALTPGAYLEQTEVMLRDNPPKELYRELVKHMQNIGFDANSREMLLFKTFTENPNYTPHDKAYITEFLVKLASVRGLPEVLQTLATVSSTEDAAVLFNQLQFLNGFNGTRFQLAEFVVTPQNIFAKDNGGGVVAIMPYDILDSTRALDNSLGFLKTLSAPKRGVWVIGTASPNFRSVLQAHGVTELRENILHYNPVAAAPVPVKAK